MATFQSLNIGLIKTLNYNKHQIITDITYQEHKYSRENFKQH